MAFDGVIAVLESNQPVVATALLMAIGIEAIVIAKLLKKCGLRQGAKK